MTLTVVSNPVCAGEITHQPDHGDWAFYPDDNVTLQASPYPGYAFVNWTGDVAEIPDTTQSTIILAMDGFYSANIKKINLTANFAPTGEVYTVTVEASPPIGGYAVVGTRCGDFITDNTESTISLDLLAGTEVSLTATALEGYSFRGWSGDFSDSRDNVTLLVDSPKEIRAVFAKPHPFPWAWAAAGLVAFLCVAAAAAFLVQRWAARPADTPPP